MSTSFVRNCYRLRVGVLCLALLPPVWASVVFEDDFTSSVLDSVWKVQPGNGSYSLTASPDYLKYSLNPQSSHLQWSNADISYSFSGESWEFETKVHSVMAYGQGQQLYVGVFFEELYQPIYWARDKDCCSRPPRNDIVADIKGIQTRLPPSSEDTYYVRFTRAGQKITIEQRRPNEATFTLIAEHTYIQPLGSKQNIFFTSSSHAGGNSYAEYDFVKVTNNNNLLASYSFEEGDGRDSSRNDLHGIISGPTSKIPGACGGNALSFQHAYMILPSDLRLAFDKGDSFSIALWFKTAPMTDIFMDNPAIITTYRYPPTGNKYWHLSIEDNYHQNGTVGYVGFGLNSPPENTSGSYRRGRLDDNQWHHFVLIRDTQNQTASLYVDGELITNVPDATTSLYNEQAISIGNHLERLYDFSMDELNIYSKVLTKQEIEELSTCPLYGVHDARLNDSQLFTVSPRTLEIKALGKTYQNYDIEAMDIHPKTLELYVASGDDTANPGHLYQVNKATGQLTDLGPTGFREVDALSFHPDGTLWGWAQDAGLFKIEHFGYPLVPKAIKLVISNQGREEIEVEDISWNLAGTLLYGAQNLHGTHDPDGHSDPDRGVRLWTYDGNMLNTLCDQTMESVKEVEALETLPDDTLLFGYHDDKEHKLVTGKIAVPTCQITIHQEIPTLYNDVEGFAWPNTKPNRACIQVITYAINPKTGEQKAFPTPCDVPEGWEIVVGRLDQ